MDDLENLEKLAKLREKNILSEEEYNNIKTYIVNKHILVLEEKKSGVAYALLAWFLGVFGAHNFYAGYTKRAIAQLLLTLFSWVLLFIPLFVVQLWALGDLCFVNKDARGNPFVGDKVMVMIIRIAAVTFYIFGFFLAFIGFFVSYYAPAAMAVTMM